MSTLRVLIISLVLSSALAGCVSQASEPSGLPDVGQAPEGPAPQSVSIEAMTPSEKRELIAPNFPIEVPVPAGSVTRSASQGDDAWDYEVVVDVSAESLADWYRGAYSSRSWQVVEDGASGAADEGSGYETAFRKGAAESRVVVTAQGEGAKAAVILGVGAPVLQTQ